MKKERRKIIFQYQSESGGEYLLFENGTTIDFSVKEGESSILLQDLGYPKEACEEFARAVAHSCSSPRVLEELFEDYFWK